MIRHSLSIVRAEEPLWLGKVVERMESGETRRFIVTSVYDDGLTVLTPIPDELGPLDLGRKFFRARVELRSSRQEAEA